MSSDDEGDLEQVRWRIFRTSHMHNGYSPAQLSMGILLNTQVPIHTEELIPRLPDLDLARDRQRKYRATMPANYDRRHAVIEGIPLSAGDRVWIPDLQTEGALWQAWKGLGINTSDGQRKWDGLEGKYERHDWPVLTCTYGGKMLGNMLRMELPEKRKRGRRFMGAVRDRALVEVTAEDAKYRTNWIWKIFSGDHWREKPKEEVHTGVDYTIWWQLRTLNLHFVVLKTYYYSISQAWFLLSTWCASRSWSVTIYVYRPWRRRSNRSRHVRLPERGGGSVNGRRSGSRRYLAAASDTLRTWRRRALSHHPCRYWKPSWWTVTRSGRRTFTDMGEQEIVKCR